MSEIAYLSVRVPTGLRNRIKALAARRGESVQDLMRRTVDRILEEDERPETLEAVGRRLREQRVLLETRGVIHLWVFGSTARGDRRPESDVDLIAEFAPDLSLTAVSSLRQDLQEIVGRAVDLAEWRALRPSVREAAQREAVQVF